MRRARQDPAKASTSRFSGGRVRSTCDPRQPPPTTVQSRMQGSQGLLCICGPVLAPGSSTRYPGNRTRDLKEGVVSSERSWRVCRQKPARSKPGRLADLWPYKHNRSTCSVGGRPVHCVQVSTSCREGRMRDSESTPPGQSGADSATQVCAAVAQGCAGMRGGV